MSVRVKICGITRLDDALGAVEAGAEALGFMFYEPSPRNVSVNVTADIIRRLPPFVAKVGVFVNATEKAVLETISLSGIDTLQFHGDETPEFCRKFSPLKVYKAFRIERLESLHALPAYETDAWLLDGFAPDKLGGTGSNFNWELAVEAKKLGRPIILAGGLTPENVAEAVRKVRPYAVDVSSGVESAPGKKDRARMQRFIAAAKAVTEKASECASGKT
ncbi:MAG: phosphoribosylanthranilate isomerase [Verrucomicrobia bacterium]|nr:MAG: phosphoribosylanthranilate isomerase [Verrucomicrobiota bacterium]